MKKYLKTFGEKPETVVVLRTNVFFNAEGIAEVEDDAVADVLDAVPGYEFVSEGGKKAKADKAPEKPKQAPVEEPMEEVEDKITSEEDKDNEEESVDAPKIVKRAPRRPGTKR